MRLDRLCDPSNLHHYMLSNARQLQKVLLTVFFLNSSLPWQRSICSTPAELSQNTFHKTRSDLRLEPRPTGVEAGVVEVAGELLPELPLDVEPCAQPLQLVPQPPVRPLAVASGLKFTMASLAWLERLVSVLDNTG